MKKSYPYARFSAELEQLFAVMHGECALAADADPERLFRMVHKNRIEPLVAARLSGMPDDRLSDIVDRLTLQTMRQVTGAAQLMALFAKNDIRAILFKGVPLSIEIYGDPAMRWSKDMDILISGDDLLKASSVLSAAGWKSEELNCLTTPRRWHDYRLLEQHISFEKDSILLELHWRPFPWDEQHFDMLWDARRNVTLGGVSMAVPGAVHQLAYLIAHGGRHGYHRLRWLADIATIIKEGADIDAVFESLREIGQESLFVSIILLLYRCAALQMPRLTTEYVSAECSEQGCVIDWKNIAENTIGDGEALTDALLPFMEAEEDVELSSGYARYRRLVPPYQFNFSRLRRELEKFRPRVIEWSLIDIPDRFYFLYWLIRPVYKLYRIVKKRADEE